MSVSDILILAGVAALAAGGLLWRRKRKAAGKNCCGGCASGCCEGCARGGETKS